MTSAAASSPTPPAVPSEPASYAEQLAALEARRRAADDILLRKMLQPRDPMNPGLSTAGPDDR